jgi:hypothetical protein
MTTFVLLCALTRFRLGGDCVPKRHPGDSLRSQPGWCAQERCAPYSWRPSVKGARWSGECAALIGAHRRGAHPTEKRWGEDHTPPYDFSKGKGLCVGWLRYRGRLFTLHHSPFLESAKPPGGTSENEDEKKTLPLGGVGGGQRRSLVRRVRSIDWCAQKRCAPYRKKVG